MGMGGDLIGLLNSSGALVQSVRYGPYGENTTASGSASYSATNDAFLFQGGYHLAGGNAGAGNVPNNLYHYGARYYDPTTGRWTQPDPLGGGYPFAGDDPINATDPSGQLPSWLLRLLGVAKKIPGLNFACVVVHAAGWKLHHPLAAEHYQGPSVGTILGWAYDCTFIHEVEEELF
jgi:RHS repeat-associated protein